MKAIPFLFLIISAVAWEFAQAQTPTRVRSRDLGIPFPGRPGPYNAITDVKGVEVGYHTLSQGAGPRAVRTGVTAILPRGNKYSPVYASWYSLNGNGELTGTTWVQESGFLETPILITNTNSVGTVRDATLKWMSLNHWHKPNEIWFAYPVVGETYDGLLNDILGFHIKENHVLDALSSAKSGPIAEGNVGGGTGMVCLGFKGGTGTSSRMVTVQGSSYVVGALVQSNFGSRTNLTITGIPVGKLLADTLPISFVGYPEHYIPGSGSIIVVIGTDAPLLPHQLKRIAQRIPLGIGRVGGIGDNGSGDIFLTFSTANEGAFSRDSATTVQQFSNDLISPLFEATVQAVEEAIINAMVAAETTEGIHGNKVHALPHDKVREIIKRHKVETPSFELTPNPDLQFTKSELSALVGDYVFNKTNAIQIVVRAGKLYCNYGSSPDQSIELTPITKDLFIFKVNQVKVLFDVANRRVSLLRPNGIERVYLKK